MRAQRSKLVHVLINLIKNGKEAMTHTAERDRVLVLEVGENAAGDAVVSVRDAGEGIDPAHQARLFTHGFTTKPNGHGFGLHNCANAAQEMDGSLEAASDGPGLGARFVLRLPMQYAEDGVPHAGTA